MIHTLIGSNWLHCFTPAPTLSAVLINTNPKPAVRTGHVHRKKSEQRVVGPNRTSHQFRPLLILARLVGTNGNIPIFSLADFRKMVSFVIGMY